MIGYTINSITMYGKSREKRELGKCKKGCGKGRDEGSKYPFSTIIYISFIHKLGYNFIQKLISCGFI
jgi:hypothetical protein